VALTSEWINDMNSNTQVLEKAGEDILAFSFSDEALEAAASTAAIAAVTMVGAPTVSILVACCGNPVAARERG
jgi:aspartate/tyrosine/aromatic aminotransferase